MSVSVDVGSELAEGDFLCLVINGNGIDAGRTHATVPERETVFSADDFFFAPSPFVRFCKASRRRTDADDPSSALLQGGCGVRSFLVMKECSLD